MSKITFTGKSGQKYEFQLHTIGTELESNSGVYVFLRKLTKYHLVYIGETHDFCERLNTNFANHTQQRCIVNKGATHIATFRESDEGARLRIETDIRHGYPGTPCNQQGTG